MEEEEPWRGCFEAVVKAPVSQVWEVTSDFMGVKRWTSSVVSAVTLWSGEHNKVGCVRRCDGVDGAFLGQERLLTMEEEHHRYSYLVEEASIPGLAGYVGTFHLTPSPSPSPSPSPCLDVAEAQEPPHTHISWSYQVPPNPSSTPLAFQAFVFDFYGLIISDLEKLLLPL